MLLSIVTVCYNNIEGLRATHNSVVQQDFTDYEWIAIDGGSTDGSAQFIEEHRHHFAYAVSEPDRGVYHAMNKALAQCHGEWVLFLNSGDTLYAPTTLSTILSRPPQCDVMYGNAMLVETHADAPDTLIPDHYPPLCTLQTLLQRNICHQAIFYRRSCFQGLAYDESYRICADLLLNATLMIQGKTFCHVPHYVCRCDRNGISTQIPLLQQEYLRVYDIIAARLLLHGDTTPYLMGNILKRRSCRTLLRATGALLRLMHRTATRVEQLTHRR